MKTYIETVYSMGRDVQVEVKVPTPKEFQSRMIWSSEDGSIQHKVVITNFSFGGTNKYGVALFEKDPNASEFMREKGWDWEDKAKSYHTVTFEGANARQDAIWTAASLLVYGRL